MNPALPNTTVPAMRRSAEPACPALVPRLRRRAGLAGPTPGWVLLVVGVLLGSLGGCVTPEALHSAREREIEAAARPLLEMRPDANWTACYNRLLELGPASIDHLASRPVMRRRAAPDDLCVMLHTSLLRLLAYPVATPRLSANCFETTLDVLHFDLKVGGRRLGEVCLPMTCLPAAWHDLYPADFDHGLAARIDVEGDRRRMLRWWQAHRGAPPASLARRPLRPHPEYLWPILSRRYADVWTCELKPEVLLCTLPPTGAALLREGTHDYNLVRAVCIWLGTLDAGGVQQELIELVGHPSPVVAYNARFALRHSRDPRIREVLERYNRPVRPGAPAVPSGSAVTALLRCRDVSRAPLSLRSCDEQGNAPHEMDQVHACLCRRDRCGDLYRCQVRQH